MRFEGEERMEMARDWRTTNWIGLGFGVLEHLRREGVIREESIVARGLVWGRRIILAKVLELLLEYVKRKLGL